MRKTHIFHDRETRTCAECETWNTGKDYALIHDGQGLRLIRREDLFPDWASAAGYLAEQHRQP